MPLQSVCECLFFRSASSLFTPELPLIKTPSIKIIQSHYQHSHKKIELLDLIQFDRTQSLEMKSSTLTGCQSSFLLYFFLWIGYSARDLRGWPVKPRGPPLLALCRPPDTAKHRGAAIILLDKRVNIPCSLLMSPAKRTGSTLRPLGFYLPFLFGHAKSRLGNQVCQVPQLWPSDHITHTHTTFKGFMLHSPDSHCRFSYPPLATEALCLTQISGRNKPALVTT